MQRKITRRYYDAEDQARIAVALKTNDGNMNKTARELGIPFSTVATWKKKWEMYGYPEEMDSLLPATREDFITVATDVRWEMIEALREKVRRREMHGRDLVQGISVLTDKINILSGLATSRHEKIELTLPDPKVLAEALTAFVNKTVDDAMTRNEEIIEVEAEETSKPTLALVEGETK